MVSSVNCAKNYLLRNQICNDTSASLIQMANQNCQQKKASNAKNVGKHSAAILIFCRTKKHNTQLQLE